MNNLVLRIFVAMAGIPLIIWVTIQGGWYFFALVLIISLLSQWEMYRMLRMKDVNVQAFPGFILGVAVLFLAQTSAFLYLGSLAWFILLFMFGREMFLNKGSALINIGGTVLGTVYPTGFFATLILLRNLPTAPEINSGSWILTILFAIWICDTMAYFVGKKFGRHKLFKRVSPNKSVEGALGGFVGSILTFQLAGYLGFIPDEIMFNLAGGIIIGVIGQMGDLVESWFKRDAQIKDSSGILPGHGGILDRFDSLAFVSPAMLILYLNWV
jgi:phosphatidate cytidylyltransferase